MAETALGVFVLTLVFWVPAAWLFFDAEERGYSSYFWGGLTLVLSWVAVVVYFIVRSRRPAPAWPYNRGRIYLHVAVLTFWGLAMVAVFTIVWGLAQGAGAEDAARREDVLREQLAFGLGTTLVAAPALALHLVLMRRQVIASSEGDRVPLARLQTGLAWLSVVFAGLLGLAALVTAAFGLTGTLLEVGGIGRDGWSFVIAALVTTLISLGLTVVGFFADPEFQRGRALLAAPVVTMSLSSPAAGGEVAASVAAALPLASEVPSSRPAYCSQCGALLTAEAAYCARCGTRVAV